jgi:hypothetical protein
VLTPIATMQLELQTAVRVEIVNRSEQIWMGNNLHPINLSYHWLKDSGEFVIFEGIRSNVPQKFIGPGQPVSVEMQVATPQNPGKYILVLTMVQEGICWFEDLGFEAARLEVEVI